MRSRLAVGIALALALAGVLGAVQAAAEDGQQPPPQTPSDQQRPTFRSEVNFVRVDVYPRADGRPVPDLRIEDFEILEDGAVQKIATFEHIVIRGGTAPGERVDPRNVRESNQMAGDPRNRLFVLFLDTYHVTDPAAWHNGRIRNPGSATGRLPPQARMGPPSFVDRALSNFLQRTIGPDDLIAAMTPEMEAGELTFVRRPESIEAFLKTTWARRFSADDLDPEMESYFRCYPPDDPQHRFDGIAEEMVAREQEGRTLHALRDLVRRLGELRDERKGVLLISEGFGLFGPNQTLARRLEGTPPPQPPGVYVGPGGKPTSGTDPRLSPGGDWQKCEAARVRLANVDLGREFRDVLDQANRANASFYPVDPRGLASFDTPIDYNPISAPKGADPAQVGRPASVIEDQARLRERLETLQTAAADTDGLALVNTNDLGVSLKRVVDDLSDYYLLGYYATNAAADGTFRRIAVRVKRPGVEVRTRRGYRAATAAEVAARARASVLADPEVFARDAALASLDRMRPDSSPRFGGGFGWEPAPDGALEPRPVLWIVGELDGAAARLPEWRAGEATITLKTALGATLLSERVSVTPQARTFVRFLSHADIRAGEYLVRAQMQGEPGSVADFTEQLRITVPTRAVGTDPPPGQPLIFRRGPYTGPTFQPTLDMRFRRAERIRVDVSIAGSEPSISARLLDRKGQPLQVPVTAALREEAGRRFAAAELVLAPIAPADYLIELSIHRDQRLDKVIVPIRIVP
ncbi:MAG: VWA domain-containing protein [Acidobacteria bacterium]|nr:VWA domain-containing protein [Acidobacteriota bacterium]